MRGSLAIIFIFAACALAQNLMPPTNAPLLLGKSAGTNAAPMPWKYKHWLVSWTGSASPQVVCYRVYKASSPLGPMSLYGTTTIDTFIVDLTNGPAGFYWLSAVNAAGIESGRVPL